MKLALLEPYIARWQRLDMRDRRILIVGGVVASVLLFYALVWAPLQRDVVRLRASVPQDRAKLQLMRVQAHQIAQLRARAPTSNRGGSVLTVLEQAATTRGLRRSIVRLEPEGPSSARVVMEEADFNILLAWLADLQDQGIRAEQAVVQKKQSPGMVSVRLLLRGPGG